MKLLTFLFFSLCIALTYAKLLDESFKETPNQIEDSTFENFAESIDSDENYIRSKLPYLSSRNKRFLSSVLDIFKSSNDGSSKSGVSFIDKFDKFLCKYSNCDDMTKTNKPGTTQSNPALDSDPFYKLKSYCDRNYDDFCRGKKREMRDLVRKCESFDKKTQPDSCKEILSVYCYIYLTHDIFTCFSNDYQMYKPGAKKFTTSQPTIYTTKSSTYSSYSTRSPYTYSSSFKPITYSISVKPVTVISTTKSTTRPTTSTTTTLPTIKPTTASSGSGLVNPFGNEPFTTIPNDANKLKKIGHYCQNIKTREANCDKALVMLRDKFKKCEKSPKTDQDCQSFKMNLCGAFPKFTCCSDILAGRNCAGSKTRRSFLNM